MSVNALDEERFDRQMNFLGSDILTVAGELESCRLRLDWLCDGQDEANRHLARIAEALEALAGTWQHGAGDHA